MSPLKDGVPHEFTLIRLSYKLRTEAETHSAIGLPWICFQNQEDAVNELTVFATLFLVRVVLPLALLLAIGELARPHKHHTIRGI